MHNLGFALNAAWQVLAVSLLLGAGLPSLFAVGVRVLAYGTGGTAEADPTAAPHPVGRLVAYVLFAVVVLVALLGITYIVASGFGKTISFEHVYPAIVDK